MNEDIKHILLREDDKYRPSLENRVAYQHERENSILTVWMDRDRNKNIFRVVGDEIAARRGGGAKIVRVLDVGCAYGNHIFMLNARFDKYQDVRYVGIDVNPKALRFPQAFRNAIDGYGNCDFMLCNIEEGLPFSDAYFHVVLCSDVLEHCANAVAALREMSRVLAPGGKIVLTSPLKNSLFKTLSALMNKLTFGRLERKYLEGGTKDSPDIKKEDKPEFGLGHVSEMNLKEYLAAGREAGLEPVEIVPASVFSGSMFFDRHPFLLSCLVFIEAVHRVLRFTSWAHGIQIVFVKK